jgi:hypothetical protein
MVSISQTIGLGASALAFSALEKSDTLNRFVNWISGGTVNRNTLAQGILHKAIELGTEFALQKKRWGSVVPRCYRWPGVLSSTTIWSA